MVIYVDNRPLEFLNLDKLRRDDDPVRFEETTRMRGLPPGEKSGVELGSDWHEHVPSPPEVINQPS